MNRPQRMGFPCPTYIQETVENMMGEQHFSCLDLKYGFWQVKMNPESKKYTTFTTGNLGFLECEHMPFRLCNTPAMFQKLMQNCWGELNLNYCLIYLDDGIMYSADEAQHLERLQVIFTQFCKYNLKLKSSRCDFFKLHITYLATRFPKAPYGQVRLIW